MNRFAPWRSFALLLGSATLVSSARADEPALPPAATHQVDFQREIAPILAQRCGTCHGSGRSEGGFSVETRSALLSESDSGHAVIAGKSGASLLIELVAGVAPDRVMPQQGKRLSAEEVGLLRAWIDQGVAWDPDVSLRKLTMQTWKPTPVEPPAAAPGGSAHPVDRWLASYWKSHDQTPPAVVDDRTFARRVYYDVLGLPPTPEELAAFLADARPDKREQLVRALLADDQRYAEHWLSFWNDLLRNDYQGTGYIDGGRQQITGWLYNALATNKPLDELVEDLITPAPEAAGFVKGIVWRGAVNASQHPPLQAAQNISQVFLGINLKCASCHDSFVSQWKLQDAYALASVFSDEPLELFECDKAQGETAAPQFLNPEIGAIDPEASRAERQRQLAELFTHPENARLRRTIVNRLWARFLGRGLIEPVDEMDNPAWHGELLEWLADDLLQHDDNLKHAMERMLTSRAYQLPSVNFVPEETKDFVFQGPLVKRLSAEQFLDTIWRMTEAGPTQPAVQVSPAADARLVRASLVNADALMRSLGRPTRDQVVTTRPDSLTTLTALDLTNGEILATLLDKGAKKLLAAHRDWTAAEAIDFIYQQALCRPATSEEAALAAEIVGTPVNAAGLSDLLWTVLMLPDFQLIR